MTPLLKWVVRRAGALVAVTIVLFGLVSALDRDAGFAFEVLSGSASAFDSRADWLSVPLALMGYLTVPIMLGALVALAIDNAWSRRLLSEEEFEKRLENLLDESESSG